MLLQSDHSLQGPDPQADAFYQGPAAGYLVTIQNALQRAFSDEVLFLWRDADRRPWPAQHQTIQRSVLKSVKTTQPAPYSYPARLAAALLLIGLCGCGLLREPLATPKPTTVVQVTADQVAQAMDGDVFYATYGQTTLLIQGTVADIDRQPNHFILNLATHGDTQVLCDLGNKTLAIKAGDSVTVRSADPENDVARQDAAVLIHNCTIP